MFPSNTSFKETIKLLQDQLIKKSRKCNFEN